MKTYLVEDYNREIEFDKDSIVVALTPEVCYQLDKKRITYSIIEDYYDVVELSNQVEEHRISVFRWIENLDEFLLKNIKGLDLKLGTIYRWYLKGMILDPLYLRCYTLRHLFKTIKPTGVTYFVKKSAEPPLNYRFEHLGQSLYSQVIPLICREKNIPLKTVLLEPEEKKVKESKKGSRNRSLIIRLKTTLYKSAIVRRIYFSYRCLKKLPSFKRAGQKRHNIFLLMVSQIGEDFVAEALVRGHHVYLLSGDDVLKYSCFGTRKHLKLQPESSLSNENNWQNTAGLLTGNDLIYWVNEKCQLNVSEIVLPRLGYFVSKVCPELVDYIKEFAAFYKKADIDLFFTHSVSTLQDYAALAAANRQPKLKTACLVHGDTVYDSRVWSTAELENYKIHISSNIEAKEYFRHLADEIHSSAGLYSNPYRLLNIKKITDVREKKGTGAIRKNKVIYVPLFIQWDARRMEGDPSTDTWYYNFQKSLIEYFSTRDDFTFVWKGLPQSDKVYNPIPDFIRDNNFSNVEVATNPFIEHLLTAGRVICDSPSTAFYESIIAGVPVMSLYHKSSIVRPGAVEYFGNLLKQYFDIPKAIKHIDDFLNSDPERFKMRINMEEGSLFDILEKNGEGDNC
ncbi:MAG: hypothetical protein A2Z70_01060 [Chloroflexi bacterium RBG_13_48_17]|nr:MAG: hypothetical protein A2Z70_01060 [Chloroflexi bacterium RBG_13_48_17]